MPYSSNFDQQYETSHTHRWFVLPWPLRIFTRDLVACRICGERLRP